ncbi:nicotinamide-nucleotide amidohydrolase family protein [Brachybacterium fresconis]|uniref:PncC family amidohydrolase n=1 Tax=Brachybacterium fresconis TaxID=173363 RepID=A0ABS4YPR9_9MICO|nr:nicotinamide-nucleotide amidohydrolase family protein [Brachybacterium fresconis]MBP2410793.1 PncC family amidohydrolase [Brachybacterium fresconis]
MSTDPATVIARAAEQGLTLATAESLTAGAVVARLVDVPGASAVIAGGAACYSYSAKTRVLGVDAGLLEESGAVTAEVAAAMADGALALYDTDLAVATTGVAGPGPDGRGVPAGTVHLGLARSGRTTSTRELHLTGGRARVRAAAVTAAIDELAAALEG